MPKLSDLDQNRILIVSDAWHPQVNGVVRTLSMLRQELERSGYIVDVVGPDRFRTIGCPTYKEIRLAVLPARRLARIIAGFRPDALHIATEGPLGMAASRWAKRRKIPFTTALHTRFPEYLHARTRMPMALTYAWLRRFHGAGSGVFVATESLRGELRTHGFRNTILWSRGVDLGQFRLGLPDNDAPVFLYVGRIAVEKNIRAFLDLDLPGRKCVVGDGPLLAELRRDYPAVEFAGALHGAALATRYASADVFVFPSRSDTFGLVLLEALACGTPVAAYPVTGPLDVLAHAEGSIGAMHDDLRTACLAALAADRNACRAHAERFSWPNCASTFAGALVPIDPVRSPEKLAA